MKKLLLLMSVLVVCYGCAKYVKNSKEQVVNKELMDAGSEQSKLGFEIGEPAIIRKCDDDGFTNRLMIPAYFESGSSKLVYDYRSAQYKDIANIEVKAVRNMPDTRDFLVLADMRKILIRCDQVADLERCNYITIKELNELKKMIGKTLWLKYPVYVEDIRISPAQALKVINLSTDIKKYYAEDYYYVVNIDNKTVDIPVSKFTTKNPIKKGWDKKVVNAIKNATVFIGMTDEQALLSWGVPDKINKTTTKNLNKEQWVYRHKTGTDYLYFYNGKLEAIQN